MLDWIADLIAEGGYLGIALLMFLENLFPPIPSELIMPMAGYAASRGDLSLLGVIAAGTAGSLAGAAPWYALGRVMGLRRLKALADRRGRYVLLSGDDIDRAAHWFERHGRSAVLWGRLVPGVRTLISAPAGAVAMMLPRFLFWTAIGTTAWTALLAAGGYLLGASFEHVGAYLKPFGALVLPALLVAYVVAVLRRRRAAPMDKAQDGA